LGTCLHGQTINVSELAREAGVARTTVEGYFSVLEDTMLSWRLPAFEMSPLVRERAHPKVYWIDAGIVRSLKGSRGPVVAEERGPLIEGWVANILRANLSYAGSTAELSYLPRHGGYTEVDFIVRREEEVVAIEVKSSPRVDSRSLKSLRSIKDLSGLRRRILVCGVDRPERTEDGIDVLSFGRFANESTADQLFGG
jgi:predicted AAA+ superfamily ATPase